LGKASGQEAKPLRDILNPNHHNDTSSRPLDIDSDQNKHSKKSPMKNINFNLNFNVNLNVNINSKSRQHASNELKGSNSIAAKQSYILNQDRFNSQIMSSTIRDSRVESSLPVVLKDRSIMEHSKGSSNAAVSAKKSRNINVCLSKYNTNAIGECGKERIVMKNQFTSIANKSNISFLKQSISLKQPMAQSNLKKEGYNLSSI
jgi:hypothetical protein